eukprot:TRINITY_DN74336_c0_g1_i1.p1 TRINITY_DN74336_c0_g1~~TRINITY_DN74336_c0_g1_i1.p1  ORF type:complete len:445 (+),score=118.88 TRINITY_DN74336_c0_g1_i1:48-1382(+)
MDGLSLLGLVCEKEKQLLTEEEGKHHSSEHQYSKTEHHIGNIIDVDLDQKIVEEIKVKEEGGIIKLDVDVVSREYDSCRNISIKEDISEDADDSDDIQVMTCSDPKSTAYEKSSHAVATHLNITDFGQFIYKIQENQLCKYSKYTGWHLQRATGMMKIKLTFRNIKLKGPLMVRAVLVRKDVTYRHFGVDRICENHRKEVSLDTKLHVLQAAPGLEGMWYFGETGPRKSVCFNIGPPDINGFVEETIGLKCICNDSCSTCDDQSFKQTESSRDLLLLLTLESKDFGMILARRSIIIWPKAVVRPKDLNKPERRKPKGGAAKLNKIREMLEKPKTCDQQPRNGSLEMNTTMNKKIGNTQCSKEIVRLAPKLNFFAPSRTINPSAEHKFNILLQVDSKNGLPTTAEILESTIGYAIKNARTLGLSKSEFLEKIESKFSETEAVKRN